jgi:phage portal protein BeeE
MGFIGNVVEAYLRSRGYRKQGERPAFFEVEAQTGLWSLGDWNRRAEEELAMKVSWVYSDINMIARECSQAALSVVKEKGEETEAISNHPFEVLMRRPNPFMSRSFLMQYTVGWLKLDGNAYWLLIPGGDGLAEIWPLPASKMEPIPSQDRDKFLDGFAYEAQGRKHILPIEFVAHFRQWNHQSIYKGMSDIQAIRLAIKTDQAMQSWNWNFFGEKNAIPTTLISLPQDTSPGDFELIKEEIVNELRASKRRTAVARAGDLTLTVKFQGGAVAYVNGREVGRAFLSEGPIENSTPAQEYYVAADSGFQGSLDTGVSS